MPMSINNYNIGDDEPKSSLTIKMFSSDIYKINQIEISGVGRINPDDDEKHLGYGNPIYNENIIKIANALLQAYSNDTLDQCKLIARSIRIANDLRETIEYENVIDRAFHSVISGDALYIYICAEASVSGKDCAASTVQLPMENGHDGVYYLKYTKTGDGKWSYDNTRLTWNNGTLTVPYLVLDGGINLAYPLCLMEEPPQMADSVSIIYNGADGNAEKTTTFDPKPITELSHDLNSAVISDMIIHVIY
jgi:hypothetical protein